jgi:voltage-gated potassium channel
VRPSAAADHARVVATKDRAAAADRWRLLRELDELTEGPLVILSLVWLGLLVLELTVGIGRVGEMLVYGLWALFILDFLIEIIIAPDRRAYLRRNWLVAVSLVLPAARVLRVAQVARVARIGRIGRSLNLARIITSVNRGIRALGRTLAARGAGYVAAITFVVALGGAAGILTFESPAAIAEAGRVPPAGQIGVEGFGDALWWTLMILVTLGTDYWPVTMEGRILTVLLAVYGFAIFGYVTATLASHFLGRDRVQGAAAGGAVAGDEARALRAEIAALRAELAGSRDEVVRGSS